MSDQTVKEKKKGAFGAEDISLFCAQLALILKSGIPLQDGISAIGENITEPKAKKIIGQLQESVASNTPFYQALKDSGVFPRYMVNMIEIGEKSGKLDNVMDALSVHYSREDQLKKSVRSAILYPFILVLMMSVVIGVLVIKVLPIFNQVFQDLGTEMSSFSTLIMNIGINVAKYAFIVILVLAVLLFVAFLYSKTQKGSVWFARFFSRFGPTKKLSARIASARFASVMSMMLSSGYDTDAALEMVPNIITNDVVSDKIAAARKDIAGGMSFAEAVTKAQLFPGIYSQMVSIGMKTGNMDSVMQKLADVYNEEVDRSINRAVSIIEPILVGILSIIIGAILLSVMLPLMGIMSSIG